MVFYGTLLQLDQERTYFRIVDTNVRLDIDRLNDGTHMLVIVIQLDTGEKVFTSVQHQNIVLHEKSLAFLWTERNTEFEKMCYCFRMESNFAYGIFERGTKCVHRIHYNSMIHQSILLELKIQKLDDLGELLFGQSKSSSSRVVRPKGDATGNVRNVVTARFLKYQEEDHEPVLVSDKDVHQLKLKELESRMRFQNSTANVDDVLLCVLCQKANLKLVPHPLVNKNESNHRIGCCEKCKKEMLAKREEHLMSTSDQHIFDMCALCGDGGDHQRTIELYCCVNAPCPFSFCMNCIKKLLTAEQVVQMKSNPIWACPICKVHPRKKASARKNYRLPSVDKVDRPKRVLNKIKDDTSAQNPIQVKKPTQVKKTTQVKKPIPVKKSVPIKVERKNPRKAKLPPVNKKMDAVDYAAKYILFVVKRETGKLDASESEDACFACKDGGALMECDFRPNGIYKSSARCPKVFHEDCLGYKIPTNETWHCPRHRCCECGTKAIIHSCRFCPTSYCKTHAPKKIHILGPATHDVGQVDYFICERCNGIRLEAVKRRLLLKSEAMHDRKSILGSPSSDTFSNRRQSVRAATVRSLNEVAKSSNASRKSKFENPSKPTRPLSKRIRNDKV